MTPLSRVQKDLRFALRVIWLLSKGFLAAILIALLLAMAAFYNLPRLINGERARGLLVAQLQAAIHRPVQIDNVILTPQGIKLKGVRIIDNGDTNEHLIDSDSALITIKLSKLFERRVELNHVKLVQPRIHLWRDAAGRWNLADLFTSTAAAPTASLGRFSLPVSLAADVTSIEDGVLKVEDRLKNRGYSVSRFNLDIRRFDVDNPFSFTVSFRTTAHLRDREIQAGISGDGTVSLAGFNWPQAFLRADRLEVNLEGHPLRGSALVAGFLQPSIEFDAGFSTLGPETWPVFLGRPLELKFPAGRVRGHVELEGPGSVRVTQLKIAAAPLSVAASGTIAWTDDRMQVEAEGTLDDFPLSAAAAFRPSLARFSLDGALRGGATVTAIRNRLVVHKLNVSARGLKASFARWRVDGGDLDASAESDFSRLSVDAAHGSVRAFGQPFSDIQVSLTLAREDLKVSKLALRWADSRVKLKGEVLQLSNPKEVTISGNMDRLRWERAQQLVTDVAAAVSTPTWSSSNDEADQGKRWVRVFKYAIPRRFPDTVGHIHIGETAHQNFSFKNMDLLWDLHGVTRSLRKAGGDVRVSFGPGRVDDIQAVQSSHKFLRIVFLPYVYMHKMNSLSVLSAATAYPKFLDFNLIEGQYGVQQGVVSTRFFHVDSPQLVAYADGAADFGRESVDMNILTRLTGYRAPLPEWWVDESGRPAIGFRVKGDLSQPELEPRLRKMASDEIEKAIEDSRSRAKKRFEAIEKLETL